MKAKRWKRGISSINPLKKLMVKEHKHRSSLTMLFSVVAFLILLSALGLAWLAAWLITKYTMLGNPLEEPNVIMTTALVSGISIVIGTAVSFLFVKFPLKPINTLINHMNRLAIENKKGREIHKDGNHENAYLPKKTVLIFGLFFSWIPCWF